MTITEGRNRQVRRMIEAVGSRVLKLVRTSIGPVRIGDLEIGKWRHLTKEEVALLDRRAATTTSLRQTPTAARPRRLPNP
jgi:16S rRNA U516 pseudouridylate synthase RsuA-like enzyme